MNNNALSTNSVQQVARFSSLNDMNAEAQQMLILKQKELDSYATTISEAEDLLASLQEEMRQKKLQLDKLNTESSEEDSNNEQQQQIFYQEIAELELKYSKELQNMIAKHEEEISELRSDFEKTIQEAEQWANRHSEIAYQEKIDELNSIQKQAQNAKYQLNEITFSQSANSNYRPNLDEIHTANINQIIELEGRISDLSSLTREELRNARAKIEECTASIELRKESQESELRRLRNEAEKRNEAYKAHIDALTEQYKLEEETLQKMIDAQNARKISTENIIEQIGRHHKIQLSSVGSDIESIRRSVSSPSPNLRHSFESIKTSIRESQKLEMDCQRIEDETQLIDNEMLQLESENKSLKKELKKLTSQLSQQRH